MGKVTGSASSVLSLSGVSWVWTLWFGKHHSWMLLPWQLHAAADVPTRAPGHSVLFLGAVLGWGDGEWAEGRILPCSKEHMLLPFSGMLFPVVCLQQVLFSLFNKVVSVLLNIGDVSFNNPQLEATEGTNSSFKYFSCFAYNFLYNWKAVLKLFKSWSCVVCS